MPKEDIQCPCTLLRCYAFGILASCFVTFRPFCTTSSPKLVATVGIPIYHCGTTGLVTTRIGLFKLDVSCQRHHLQNGIVTVEESHPMDP
jgi:hypothetical protein